MKLISRLLGQALSGLSSALTRLLLALVVTVSIIAVMIFATVNFGVMGLLFVAVPVVVALFVLGYIHSGSDGTSGD
jgi:hypothetical protein